MYRKAAETGASHPAAWETSGHHRGVMAWLRLESRSGDIPWGRRQRCCGRVHCLPPWCGNLLDSWSMFPDGRVPCRATWSTVPAGHVPVRHREASRFRGVKACRAARRDGVPRGLRGVPRAPCRVRRWTRQDMPGRRSGAGCHPAACGGHCAGGQALPHGGRTCRARRRHRGRAHTARGHQGWGRRQRMLWPMPVAIRAVPRKAFRALRFLAASGVSPASRVHEVAGCSAA